ncbi:DUF1707 SHOCT-like domain-containing protein [Marmoricola sp. URHA0025 HA25]
MYRPDQRPDLRLSDADRDRAIARLSEHYAAGRLDKEEFDERSDAVWTARTYADLAPIFADLGSVPTEREWPANRGRRGPWGRRGLLPVPFVPVLLLLIALTVLTHIPFVLLAFFACGFVFLRRRRRYHW